MVKSDGREILIRNLGVVVAVGMNVIEKDITHPSVMRRFTGG